MKRLLLVPLLVLVAYLLPSGLAISQPNEIGSPYIKISKVTPLIEKHYATLASVDTIEIPAPVATVSTGCNDAKSCIYFNESGNNPGAINASSGACGLGQAWPCSKLPCSLSDYACQDAYFTQYAVARYGNWTAAWDYWQAHSNW